MSDTEDLQPRPLAESDTSDGRPLRSDEDPAYAPEPRESRASRRDAGQRRSGRRRPPERPDARRAARAVAATRASRATSAGGSRLLIALGLLVAVVAALGFGVWTTLYRPLVNVAAGKAVTVVIASGSSGDQVAEKLAAAGVVASPTMFRIQAQMMGATSSMKAGTYELNTGSGYEAVIRRLQAGPEITTITVTIPEGWGVERIAARVESKLGIPAADFIDVATTKRSTFDFAFLATNPTDTLEGYLFPKTYTFKKGVKATEVISTMLAQYGTETAGLDYTYAKSKNLSAHDVLTIASIIEREASVASDRPKVASVIYNRLHFHMRLQLDSTVQYALNGKAKLTLADLQTQSPYNTYMNAGLPPGPICNPGIIAIKAALDPAKTKYLYYILTYKDGRQSFATNYADFLRLKAQYKKGLK